MYPPSQNYPDHHTMCEVAYQAQAGNHDENDYQCALPMRLFAESGIVAFHTALGQPPSQQSTGSFHDVPLQHILGSTQPMASNRGHPSENLDLYEIGSGVVDEAMVPPVEAAQWCPASAASSGPSNTICDFPLVASGPLNASIAATIWSATKLWCTCRI